MNDGLCQAVRECSQRPDLPDALAAIYADLQVEIDERRPICKLSGQCCRFEQAGHRLYVTTLELATFLHQARSQQPAIDLAGQVRQWNGLGCPFQLDNRCAVHPIRPLACRIFFCDPGASAWQTELYERFHGRLKRLHDSLGVSYYYLEWRDALRQLLV